MEAAADRWEQIVVGDLPDVLFNGILIDDLRISGVSTIIDGPGGILGSAGPGNLRSDGTFLPYTGNMTFDSADVQFLESTGQLFAVALHEMGHVLGIGTLWSLKGLLVGAGTADPRFIGPLATAEYNLRFGVNESGVPVENTGGGGTRDSHWRESIFGAEIMTGFLNQGVTNPLSAVTAASLADLGYSVNMAAVDAFLELHRHYIFTNEGSGNTHSRWWISGWEP